MPNQIPYGNAFLVQTPEIDHVQDQLFQQQQMRRMYQQQEMSKLDPIMDREFSKIRSVDVPAFTTAYNNYKNIKKQMLFDPQLQHNPQAYQQANQQANEALANTFSIADQSSQYNQMGRDLMVTRRTHPDVYGDDFGDKFKTLMSTPIDQLKNTQYGDLTNPDNFRYQHVIDFNKLNTVAMGKPQTVDYQDTKPTPDGLSNVTTTYKAGANPKQYHDNLLMQLSKQPTGEREAASAMQQFSPEMIDEINKQYYDTDPASQQKWLKTTGQPTPMPVEPNNPNSLVDQYSSLMSKLVWLKNQPAIEKIATTPNRGAILDTRNEEQNQRQQNSFQQQKLMEGIKNTNALSRIQATKQLQDLYAHKNESEIEQSVDDQFNNEFNNAKTRPPISIPTASGNPLTGYEVDANPIVDKSFVQKDATGHNMMPDKVLISNDGKTRTGVYLTKDNDGNTIVDDAKTKQISVQNAKTTFRNFVAGKQKVAPLKNQTQKPNVQLQHGLLDNLQ